METGRWDISIRNLQPFALALPGVECHRLTAAPIFIFNLCRTLGLLPDLAARGIP